MEMTGSSEWIFETITKYTIDMIAIIDENRKVHFMTPIFYEIFDIDPDKISTIDIFDILHPDDREMMESRHKNVISTQKKSATEYRVIDKFGKIRHFESKSTPFPSENNLVVVAIRDITERKKMEHELEARKNRYEQLQSSLKDYAESLVSVMKVSDLEEKLIEELKKIIPFSEPSILIYDKKDQEKEDEVSQVLSGLTVGKIVHVENSIFLKIGERNDRSYILSLCQSSIHETMDSIWLETLIYYTVMVFENLNVLENLMGQLESALQSKETPRWVLRLLFNLQEQQRLNLSSDLHDTVLQDQIDLYRRLESLLNNSEFLDSDTKKQLKSIEQGLLDTIHEIRATCNELRPPLLIELGLGRALENLFDYTQVTSTYKIIFIQECQKLHSLDEEQIIGIYRIVQELLNNAEKHSKATEVTFVMAKKNGLLTLTYKDNGIGFDSSKLDPSFNHMGLTNIKHRAQSLGGNIIFDSQINHGLSIKVDIPITE